MTRWLTPAVALAGLLVVPELASAQNGHLYSPVGAARTVDPTSQDPKRPNQNLAPGTITPEMAPLGPPPDLALPADHTSAFQTERFPVEQAFYAALGVNGMQLYRVPHLQTVFNEVSGIDRTPQQFYPTLPDSARPALQDLAGLNPTTNYGPRVTMGYLVGDQAFEVTGWYAQPNAVSLTNNGAGNLTVPYGTLSRFIPAAFAGDNNLWVNADRVTTSFSNQLGSVELNYRSGNSGIASTELLMGLRYVHAQQTIGIDTIDDIAPVNVRGGRDATREALVSTNVRNNMFAFQFGGEYSAPIPIPWVEKYVSFNSQAKAGIGPNVIQRRFKLVRGDGLQGLDVVTNDIQLGQVYELNAAIDFSILERLRFRIGYQAMYLLGVSNATSQVDFDLSHQGRRGIDYNSQFYHGPMAEFQLLF